MASDTDDYSSDDSLLSNIHSLSKACSKTLPTEFATESKTELGLSSDSDDDLELLNGIKERYKAACSDEPLNLKPLNVLLPDGEKGYKFNDIDDDDEDDEEILRSIQKRFQRYNQDADWVKSDREEEEQVGTKDIYSEKETSSNVEPEKRRTPKAKPNTTKEVPGSSDIPNTPDNPEVPGTDFQDAFSSCFTEGHESDFRDSAMVPTQGCGFPKAAQMFIEAIRKNRACQKFIRNKMMQTEARIEENKKLQHRVKLLRGFQVKLRKETTRALSQKQDARLQLISGAKPKGKSKANGKKDSALCRGPADNSHVACYRTVSAEYRKSLNRRKWTDEERENLAKGIKQQFQELLLQRSVDLISEMDGDSDDVDGIYASIKDHDITPENMRSFLPKVNWERLASMYVKGRSGGECEARWLNWEDPLINHQAWTKVEDKKLLHIVQQRGISNWIEIAVLLETNRTPFQCLARYQRSLNASVIRSEWSKDEDEKLCAAVAAFGESSWENVAATLVGRTGPQCSNRWVKSLNPAREKIGRWSLDEDKRVKVAVVFFGKNWKKVAQFVPGRTHVQCRERWANCLDPSLNMGEWTEEEDSKLKAAIEEHGYCWTKVAACVPSRTDNQCTRRWKTLFPREVPLLKAARKIQKAALISNFVDRESERPALGPNDFLPLALKDVPSKSGELNQSKKQRKKPRSKKATKESQKCTADVEKIGGIKNNSNKNSTRRRKNCKKASEMTEDARVDKENVPLDGEVKKKTTSWKRKMGSRSTHATKEARISRDEFLLTNSADVEKVARRRISSKNNTRRCKKKKEKATEGAGIGQEIVPFDGETKKKYPTRKRKRPSRFGKAEEAQTYSDELLLTNCVDIEQVSCENPPLKYTRGCIKDKQTFKASEDARVGQRIEPFDVETKKKRTIRKQKTLPRSEDVLKKAQSCNVEIILTSGFDAEKVAGGKINLKRKPTQRKNIEASEAIVDRRVCQKSVPLNGKTRKKRTTSKKQMAWREGPKANDIYPSSRDDMLLEVDGASEQHPKKRSIGPTNSRASACGDSEVSTAVEEVGEHIKDKKLAKNKTSSKFGQKNEQSKKIDEAGSSFGENENFSEVRKFSSAHLEQDWHADPTEVNSSPCPRKTNICDVKMVACDGKRRKGSIISRSNRIKCRALLREDSDITEFSDSETLGSVVLKKRILKRCSKMLGGLNHSPIKSSSVLNKEVAVIDGRQLISIMTKASQDINSSARDSSCSLEERRDGKPRERKSKRSKLTNKFSTVDDGTLRGERRKRARIDEHLCNGQESRGEENDMTLASLAKKQQKKRRLNSPPKTPFGELSNRPARNDLLDGNVEHNADDDDTCYPPPGFEEPIYNTGHHLVLV